MSTQLFYKSPDMELYNLMSVDTSGYKLGQSLLDENLIMMAKEHVAAQPVAAQPVAPIMMPKQPPVEEGGSSTPIIIGGVSVAMLTIGAVVCCLNNRRNSGAEDGEHAHEGGNR